jgi:hypothetical protein
MTPEAQRIAIAEACGLGDYNTSMNGWHAEYIRQLPDYLNDLNAMHEAEKAMSVNDRNLYIDTLGTTYHDSWEFCTATAAQRAEAFLKTIGKWEE